jgi:hypothetical protein
MIRYTTKSLGQMDESEQGEFVRYEAVEQEDKKNAQMFKTLWIDWINTNQEVIQARDLIDRLELRLGVLYCIVVALIGALVSKLDMWSLGL